MTAFHLVFRGSLFRELWFSRCYNNHLLVLWHVEAVFLPVVVFCGSFKQSQKASQENAPLMALGISKASAVEITEQKGNIHIPFSIQLYDDKEHLILGT